MTAPQPTPPRLATLILRALLPTALRDELSEELAELHALRVARDGKAAADRWYRWAVLGFGLRMRLQGGVATDAPAASGQRPAPRTLGESMAALINDLRYGLRGLRRNPGFATVAVLTLAIGIGANAAIFSVVRNVLLRPLPFPEPDRLVQLWESRVWRGFTQASFTHANFWDVRDQNRSLEAVGAMTWGSLNLTGQEQPVRLSTGQVTAGFLQALGVRPLLGRVFVTGEDEPSADTRIVVLSHRLWRDRFGSDSAIVGRRLTLSGENYAVIGVLPRGTPWLDWVDLFVPKVHGPDQNRGSFELRVVGRLKPGVTMERAREDLNGIARRLAEQYPEDRGMGVTVGPSSTPGWRPTVCGARCTC